MTLGDLIATLHALPARSKVKLDTGTVPFGMCSWRGAYDELTIDNGRDDADPPTVRQVLGWAMAADGATFTGYKGGDYAMDRKTRVWADPWGESNLRAVVGARIEDGDVVLVTAHREY